MDSSSLLTIDERSVLLPSQAPDNPSVPYFDPLPANPPEEFQAIFRDLETYQRLGVLENDIDQLGQINVYIPESLGSFGDTSDAFNPLFSAQNSSNDVNAHASGFLGYSNTDSMHSGSASSLEAIRNPAVTSSLQQNPSES